MKFVLAFLLLLIVTIGSTFAGIYSYLSPEAPPPPILSPSSVRQLASGEVAGIQGNNDAHAWLAIPYAKPPVGDLRWRAPRPVVPWLDRRQALTVSDRCPQFSINPNTTRLLGSEDCLYLNVFSPIVGREQIPSGEDALPVMFWIHGGANTMGQGGETIYDGSLMATEHNVIVVTINYRLGPLGWFAHPSLREEDTSLLQHTRADNSGNYGTLDIIEALKWVQVNIAAFGGNPANVTIYGESAGGWNVLSMMASPLAEGLFHRAISQSGGLTIVSMASAENNLHDDEPGTENSSREIVNRLLVNDGTAESIEAARLMQDSMSKKDLATWLRKKSPQDLFEAYDKRVGSFISMPILLADGHVLPADMDTAEIFSDTENYNEVPIILGTNRDETKLFMMWDDLWVNKIAGFPATIKDIEAYNREASYRSDSWKASAVDELASLMLNAQGEHVYAYRFDADDWRNLGMVDFKDLLGAAHAMDLLFVFGNFPNPIKLVIPESSSEGLRWLSNSMMSYWAQFAYTGSPGRGRTGEEVTWQAWQNSSDDQVPRLLILDSELDEGIRMSSERIFAQDIKQAFLEDTSYATQQAHCDAYKRVFTWIGHFDEKEYQNLGKSGCSN